MFLLQKLQKRDNFVGVPWIGCTFHFFVDEQQSKLSLIKISIVFFKKPLKINSQRTRLMTLSSFSVFLKVGFLFKYQSICVVNMYFILTYLFFCKLYHIVILHFINPILLRHAIIFKEFE